jgi:hypothetical protein
MLDIEASLEMHAETGSWLDLFRGTNRRRTMIAVVIPAVEGWQGQGFFGSYIVLFLIQLGASNPFFLSLMIQVTVILTLTFTFWTPDYFGRRPMVSTKIETCCHISRGERKILVRPTSFMKRHLDCFLTSFWLFLNLPQPGKKSEKLT